MASPPRRNDRPLLPASEDSTAKAGSLATREAAEANILAAHEEAIALLATTTDYAYLPWQRITDDATFRTALIVQLFHLAQPALGQQRINQQFAYGRCDSEMGNSGQSRGYDETPWL